MRILNIQLPNFTDPQLIRETKAHSQMISSIEKINFKDCRGIISGAKDGKTLTFSLELNLWGRIKQMYEASMDNMWVLPAMQKQLQQKEEI